MENFRAPREESTSCCIPVFWTAAPCNAKHQAAAVKEVISYPIQAPGYKSPDKKIMKK